MHENIRFDKKVQKTESCWLWVGAKYRRGYGHFRRFINDKWVMYKTHRFAYERFKGPIPEGLFILHTCDNPSCVNPDHLFAGTHTDNMRDMFSKGRYAYPRNPSHNQLSLDFARNVREFRKEFPLMKQTEIAHKFGISKAQTSRILNNKIWPESEEV